MATAFALMAGYATIAVVKQRGAKRQREFAVGPTRSTTWRVLYAPDCPSPSAVSALVTQRS